uniref:Semaphorin 7A n=1 Tax=Mola mola TaxID=94237 RepID=A0A3Q3VP26_MOLML
MDKDGNFLQFRRKVGSRTNPTFISASWVKRKEDPDNDKIYMFFREKNSDPSPEADRWISRVARVCKVDEGGSKRFFQNMWTSFLKARLVCGFPEESLYFNRLQDIYVMHADNWRHTRIYALFTSSWNSTAVCIYSIDGIEDVFENSTFKGYDYNIPTPRPGTCATNSRSLPLATVNVVKDYSEMTDWVHSIQYRAPFYISSNNYTRIVVDQVRAADQWPSLLCFAIYTMCSFRKKLVFGFSEKISTVDLQRCQDYNDSCENCVLARDPYCAWSTFGCMPTIFCFMLYYCVLQSEQNIANRSKRETVSPTPADLGTVHLVPLGVPFYLSCPIASYHADYTWRHGHRRSPCLQMQSNCLHLIPVMTEEYYGKYECVSEEKGYAKVVKNYQLSKQLIPDTNTDMASAVAPQLWISLGMAVAVTTAAHAQITI